MAIHFINDSTLIDSADQLVNKYEDQGLKAQERVRENLDAALSADFAPGQLADAIAYLTVSAVLQRAVEFQGGSEAAIKDAVRTGIRTVGANSTDPAANAAHLKLHQVWLEAATELELI